MSGGRLVSIVDDDESVRQAIHGLLRSVALPVVAFASAEDFLRSDHLESTGCLILDLRMPGMDGLELYKRLAREGRRIPIIILTAHGDDAARASALEAGAVAFLRKPADPEALLAAVESSLGRR